ncbi:MAG: hypothetical protein QOI55_1916, partial [Actinomycetota bacterium]|nr:hypothetical protein [Actinomycetota bacterium]
MDAHDLIDIAPPGARPHRARPFRSNLLEASIAAGASVVAAGLTWWMLWFFDQSLSVAHGQLVAARLIEVALA